MDDVKDGVAVTSFSMLAVVDRNVEGSIWDASDEM